VLTWASAIALADSGPRGSGSPFTKVLIVIFENADYQDAVAQPFFAQFAREGALLTNMHAEMHPSQPNYLALVSGDTHEVTTNKNVTVRARHVGDLLEAKGKSWKSYLEDYPGACSTGAFFGTYVRKHNPFISFGNVQQDAARCTAHLVDSDTFHTDVQSGNLPDFALYVPNQLHNGHDTDVSYADRWFASTFGALLYHPTVMQGLLVIATFDEAKDAGLNHIYTAFRGDMVKPGAHCAAPTSHYSLLKMIEDAFGLGTLGREDARAAAITGIWAGHSSGE
jgi:phospholipase C